jgi:hypothetical protein
MIDKDLLHRLQDLNNPHTNDRVETQADDESTDNDGDDHGDVEDYSSELQANVSSSPLVEHLFIDPLIDLDSVTLHDMLSDEPLIPLQDSEVDGGRVGPNSVPEDGRPEANWNW